MSSERPVELRLTSHRQLWWILLPVAIIGLVTVAVWLSVTVMGGADAPDADVDWTVPALGIGGAAVVLLLIWAGTVALWRNRERHQVRQVLSNVLVHWPQFATEEQWRREIAESDKPSVRKSDVVVPAVIVAAVVLVIAVPAAVNELWAMAAAVVTFGAVVVALLLGRYVISERERRADRRWRERLGPIPSCWLSAEAIYHENWGLLTLDRLTGISVVPPSEVSTLRKRLLSESRKGETDVDLDPWDARLARSGWSLLQLSFDERLIRTPWHRFQDLLRNDHRAREIMPISVTFIRVPPGREGEATGVAAEIGRRWLGSGALS